MARPRKNPANTVNFKLIYSQRSAGRKWFFLFLDLYGDAGGDNVSEGSAIVRCRTDASFMTPNFDYVVNTKSTFNNCYKT